MSNLLSVNVSAVALWILCIFNIILCFPALSFSTKKSGLCLQCMLVYITFHSLLTIVDTMYTCGIDINVQSSHLTQQSAVCCMCEHANVDSILIWFAGYCLEFACDYDYRSMEITGEEYARSGKVALTSTGRFSEYCRPTHCKYNKFQQVIVSPLDWFIQ